MVLPTSLEHTSNSNQQLRLELRNILHSCRQGTLNLIKHISPQVLRQQAHPDFSPVGWHLGHIAFTESLWILEHLAQQPCPYPNYQTLFAADGLPKAQRQQLPNLDTLLNFLYDVHQRTLAYLDRADLEKTQRVWSWLIQHECQHTETISLVLALHQSQGEITPLKTPQEVTTRKAITPQMLDIPAGRVYLGLDTESTGRLDSISAIDNEQPGHWVDVATFAIANTPVTCKQYAVFIEAGGYKQQHWWCNEGWQWLQSVTPAVTSPRYWPTKDLLDFGDHPVSGVNWYEASAYARFREQRLPTEAEWSRAAQGLRGKLPQLLSSNQINCNHHWGQTTPVGSYPEAISKHGCYDLLGNVWEWTSSWFQPYPGFQAYPYNGYSAAYFDNRHRVLRGGSWATRPWALRPSFRNWYEPHVRELFMGFRCAQSK
ncbi:MAG: SUMF1/EgtB/PvdO family nonheme iron enzyme [Cyanobacteria bacterium J06642_11]